MIRRLAAGCGCANLLLLALLLAAAVLGSQAGWVSAASATGITPPTSLNQPQRIAWRPLFPWTPAAGEANAADWPQGQCTWFVVSEGHAGGDHLVTWSGDAWTWIEAATAAHVPTEPPSDIPQPGWIAVYERGHGSSASAGHVAVVVAVAGATYSVAEANVLGLGVVDLRTLPLPTAEDQGGAPVLEGWIP